MDIKQLFAHRDELASYPVHQFALVDLDLGVHDPIVYVVQPDALRTSAQLTINKLPDVVFDLHVVYDAHNAVVAYVVDTKFPRTTTVFKNGVAIRQTVVHTPSTSRVKYSFDEFQVVTNDTGSAVVFCRNITTTQVT